MGNSSSSSSSSRRIRRRDTYQIALCIVLGSIRRKVKNNILNVMLKMNPLSFSTPPTPARRGCLYFELKSKKKQAERREHPLVPPELAGINLFPLRPVPNDHQRVSPCASPIYLCFRYRDSPHSSSITIQTSPQ